VGGSDWGVTTLPFVFSFYSCDLQLFPMRIIDPASGSPLAVHPDSTKTGLKLLHSQCKFAIWRNYDAIRTSKAPYLAREYNARTMKYISRIYAKTPLESQL
jgi:hypothetical protein